VRLERALLLARYDPRREEAAVRADVALALADARSSGCRRCAAEVPARCAEALARIGDADAARELLVDRRPGAAHGNRALEWWGAQARAAVLTVDGPAETAAAAWDEVVREAVACGMELEALLARIDLAGVLTGTDRKRAATVLREAAETAETMGARTELQAVEQGLRALGVVTWRRAATAGPPTLSDREREVAGRVAAGENNAEIAAAMFLSRKTVERHVSHVLAKWGLRNRAELAAAWTADAAAQAQPEGVPR
jgi:DNA-binding NarL/FixJ family response regulator